MEPPRSDAGESYLYRLRQDAEKEMRRTLDESRPHKRPRRQPGGESEFVPVDRYSYSAIEDLEAGARGFIITCNFRKEKCATREAVQLLRRYMPAHLFPQTRSSGGGEEQRQQQDGEEQRQQQDGEEQRQQQEGEEQPQQQDGEACCPVPTEGDLTAAVARKDGDAAGACAGAAEREGPHGGTQGGEAAVDLGSGRTRGGGDDKDCDSSSSVGVNGPKGAGPGEEGAAAAAALKVDGLSAPPADGLSAPPSGPSALALVKVGCRGVVMIQLSEAAAAAGVEPARVVEAMLRDLESGVLQPPRQCQRIIPLDATCSLTAQALPRAVVQAAEAYRRRQGDGAAAPFTYAIVHRTRATEHVAPAAPASTMAAGPTRDTVARAAAADAAAVAAAAAGAPPGGAAAGGQQQQQQEGQQAEGQQAVEDREQGVLDRARIIPLVAAEMSAVFGPAARVSLKKPQVAVMVEVVPVTGGDIAGLAVLGEHMFHARGKLIVKPLIKNAGA